MNEIRSNIIFTCWLRVLSKDISLISFFAEQWPTVMIHREHKQRRRRRQRERQKKQQNSISKTTTLRVLFTLFCTFLCRHCTTMTWKWLISYFEENLNTRQRLSFSLPDLRYSLLEFRSGKICQHLTNWTRWDKHRKVWSNANSLFLKVTFSQPLPPLLRKLPIG